MFSKRLLLAGVIAATGTAATACTNAVAAPMPHASSAPTVYLVTSLEGRNEVPGTKGAVGDPDGRAIEVLKVNGSTVSFSVRWRGISAPTEAHIHSGALGVNGDVKIELFSSPRYGDAARGSVTVKDSALLTALTT